MPPVQKKPSKKQSFRIGRYNGWVVVGGVAVAIIAGLYLRNKLSGQTAATQAAATQPATDTSGSSGGSGTTDSGAQPQDLTPVSDLANALNGLTGILGANGGILGAGADPFSSSFGTSPFTLDTGWSTTTAPGTGFVGNGPGGQTITSEQAPKVSPSITALSLYPAQIPASNPNFAAAASGRTIAAHAAGAPQPYGGVTATKKLANGATLTTYASGRQVEQAPGKNAYVTKKGK